MVVTGDEQFEVMRGHLVLLNSFAATLQNNSPNIQDVGSKDSQYGI